MTDRHAPGLDPSGHTERTPQGLDPKRAREAYGPIRGFFAAHPQRFDDIRRRLNQTRAGVEFDQYLATLTRQALVAAAIGALAGLLAGAGIGWRLWGGVGGGIAALAGGVLGALLAGGSLVGWRLLSLRLAVRHRARAIDAGLAHAVVFLYALTRGGRSISVVMRELGEARDVYGPVADEFALVARDMARFDMDLFTAIEHARELTPSTEFADFCDELVSVLETGGDVTAFIETAAENELERTEARQAQLLDDLTFLAQAYIAAVFVGPTLLLVTLLVVSFISGGSLLALHLLVYLGIPFVAIAFALGIGRLSRAFRPTGGSTFETDDRPAPPDSDDDRLAAYLDARETTLAERFVNAPLETIRSRPALLAVVTGPIALAFVVGAVAVGYVPARLDAVFVAPVTTSVAVFAVPFLIVATPYAVLDTLHARRRRDIRSRIPDTLNTLGDANANGVPLGESFRLVADRSGDHLSHELGRLHTDVQWTDDIAGALRRFANRVAVPDVSRIVRLLESAVDSTGDLAPVFSVVADDLSARDRLRRDRRRRTSQFVIVVAIGVLVFLGVVAAFELFFLPVIADLATQTTQLNAGRLRIAQTDVRVYRRLLIHAALLQAAGNGLLLGKLTQDRFAAGLRYACLLVALVIIVFLALAQIPPGAFLPGL